MSDNHNRELEERIARLEQRVQSLEWQLKKAKADLKDDTLVVDLDMDEQTPARGKGVSRDIPEPAGSGKPFWDSASLGENWLNRIGIGLLLLGVAFLFKYSIDQGWLIPPVRSAIGLGIGLVLFVTGLQLKEDRSPLKQILLGGGIAAFYITGFATFQLYSFISYPVVWSFMIVVTLLALSLSLQQNQAILSVIGILGGLGTPFMLYTGEGGLPSLILYTTLVLGGAGTIYLFKGWKSLLWTMVTGGWLVVLAGLLNTTFNEIYPTRSDQWALQAGILVCLGVFWVLPVLRAALSNRNPQKWPRPSFEGAKLPIGKKAVTIANSSVQVLVLIIPVTAILYSMAVWEISSEVWGVITMTLSLAVGYLYMPLRAEGLKKLAFVHGFTALILLTMSFFLLLEGDFLFIVLTLEALGLRIAALKTGDENLSVSSHLLYIVVGIWLLDSLANYPVDGLPFLNLNALTQLLIIAIAGMAVPVWLEDENSKMTYRLVAHLVLLGLFLNEFSVIENGQAYVSVCWGVYAIVILFLGFLRDLNWLRVAGMATIFLVVCKLFLVDLSQLKAIWRILLFIGFGAVFLFIGYIVQRKFGEVQDSGLKEEL